MVMRLSKADADAPDLADRWPNCDSGMPILQVPWATGEITEAKPDLGGNRSLEEDHMKHTWSVLGRWVRTVGAAVVPLLIMTLAGCSPGPTLTPGAALALPPTAVATGASVAEPASGDIDFFLNVGGGLVRQDGAPVDVIANMPEVKARLLEAAPDDGFILTARAPIACPGTLKETTLRLTTAEGLNASTSIDLAGVATFDRTVPNFVELVAGLCNGTTAEAKFMMGWTCDEVNVADREVGRLLCGQVDVTGKDDPAGAVDGPLTNCPPLPGVQMTLIRADNMVTAGPGCAAAKPSDGWQWSKTAPVLAGGSTVVGAESLDPHANPEFTDVNGVYGWIAPFDACYYVKAVHGTCTWYSSVFFVAKSTPVTELNFRRLDVPLVCDFTTVPCP